MKVHINIIWVLMLTGQCYAPHSVSHLQFGKHKFALTGIDDSSELQGLHERADGLHNRLVFKDNVNRYATLITPISYKYLCDLQSKETRMKKLENLSLLPAGLLLASVLLSEKLPIDPKQLKMAQNVCYGSVATSVLACIYLMKQYKSLRNAIPLLWFPPDVLADSLQLNRNLPITYQYVHISPAVQDYIQQALPSEEPANTNTYYASPHISRISQTEISRISQTEIIMRRIYAKERELASNTGAYYVFPSNMMDRINQKMIPTTAEEALRLYAASTEKGA